MTAVAIGGFHLERVADIEPVALPTRRGFPELTPELVRTYLAELGPKFINPETLDLFISFHTWIIRRGDRVILVDLCIGDHKDRPNRPDWHRRSSDFLDKLARAGVKPADVDAVLCTHLHADHIGWNTKLENGRWVPTFPNARYLMAETEFNHWKAKHAREGDAMNHGSFVDSVLPVVTSGQADMVSTSHQVFRDVDSGVHLEGMPGHTPGTVLIHVEDGAQHGVFTGDILHHPFQLACPDMHSKYCEDPALSAKNRLALCERYADSTSRILTAHFPDPSTGFIERDGGRFRFRFDPA